MLHANSRSVLVAGLLGEFVKEDVAIILVVVVVLAGFSSVTLLLLGNQSALLRVSGTGCLSRFDGRFGVFHQHGFVVEVVLGLAVLDGLVDDGPNIIMDVFARFVILAVLICPIEFVQAHLLGDAAQSVVKGPGELLALSSGVGAERVDGLSEEKIGCCVECLSPDCSIRGTSKVAGSEAGDLPCERRNLGC